MIGKRIFCVVLTVFVLFLIVDRVLAHEASMPADPELLVGWRTWLHLTIQWIHLVGLGLWFSFTAAPLLLGLNPPLSHLLYSSWALFLLLLATGNYNMEHSAGIPVVPSLLNLPLMGQIPYGVPYTVMLAVKQGLFALMVFFTAAITFLHARHRLGEAALRRTFLIAGSILGVLIALVTSAVLLLHEATDLWPTALHSMGGVLGPEGPRTVTAISGDSPPPNDFRLLARPEVWWDITVRWFHLLGFGLWLGGIITALWSGRVGARRFLMYSWAALAIQVFSGVTSMDRWTPFYLSPYIWNLDALSHLRFGRTYTLLMAVKQALVIAVIGVTGGMTLHCLKHRAAAAMDVVSLRPWLISGLLLGLAIAYVMIMVLLIHEGVDHVL